MRVKLLLTAVLAGLLGGCEHDEYEIEVTPRGQEIRREITAWHVGSKDGNTQATGLFDEKLAAIAKLYDKRLTQPGEAKQTFVGRFRARTPNDVGGAGFYRRLDSQMGHACAYVERFRGHDEQAGLMEEEMRKVDKSVDLLVNWFESELAGEEGLNKLREFMDKDLRIDLKNVVLYAWMGRVLRTRQAEGDANEEPIIRILQYFAERDYFSPQELGGIARALIEAFAGNSPDKLLRLAQRFLATKMGVPRDKPIPKRLAFLADPQTAKKSLEAYLRTTEEYKKRLLEWEKQPKTTTQATRPSPSDIIEAPDFGLPFFNLDLFGSGGRDRLSLKLAAPAKPWVTNGTWDANSGRVAWSSTLRDGTDLPALCYAFWSRPNEQFQKAHFGKLVLDGAELASYCFWVEGLSRDEANQWEAFLAALRPEPDLKQKLQAFRFRHELPPPDAPPEDEQPKSYAQTAIDLISNGLSEAPQTRPAEDPGKQQ